VRPHCNSLYRRIPPYKKKIKDNEAKNTGEAYFTSDDVIKYSEFLELHSHQKKSVAIDHWKSGCGRNKAPG